MSSTEPNNATESKVDARQWPFANWPTLKILTPPQGPYSRKKDEWCIAFASQSAMGRSHNHDPMVRAMCIRKVFAHEVRNVHASYRHVVGPDGKAKYPLPKEGQPDHLPRYLGGAGDGGSNSVKSGTTNFWDEGWYLWTGKTKIAVYEKITSMRHDLEAQKVMAAKHLKVQELWHEHQEELARASGREKNSSGPSDIENKLKAAVSLSLLPLDYSCDSLLVHLSSELPPIWSKIDKLLAPSWRVLAIFRESIMSGEQKEFTQRAWEKARTPEPFILASRTFSGLYERWKQNDFEDDNKGSSS